MIGRCSLERELNHDSVSDFAEEQFLIPHFEIASLVEKGRPVAFSLPATHSLFNEFLEALLYAI